jgi:hypothetical protein
MTKSSLLLLSAPLVAMMTGCIGQAAAPRDPLAVPTVATRENTRQLNMQSDQGDDGATKPAKFVQRGAHERHFKGQ